MLSWLRPVWKSTSVRVHDIATPSSRRRVDGVEVDATIQHERAVTFDFHTGDEDYTQEHICKALLDVVEDVQIKQAEEIFLEAQKGGQANVCTTSQELAEHYVQQLARKDPMIFCEMKET